MRSLRTIILLVVMAFTLLVFDSGVLFAQTTPPPPVPVGTTLDALRAKARHDGKVHVIVGLSVARGFRPESRLGSGGAVDAQRASIAQAQSTLMQSAAIDKTQVSARYKYVPYIAMTLDGPALERLINSGQAATIQEDTLHKANEAISPLPIVNADRMQMLGNDGTGWTVAIIDSGIDEDHPAFGSGSRIVSTDQACFSNMGGQGGGVSLCPNHAASQSGAGSADATTANCMNGGVYLCAHGTHVAGDAAGNAGGGFTGAGTGVASGAQILPIQVFTRYNTELDCGTGDAPCIYSSDSDMISALDYIYSIRASYPKLAAINISIGGGFYTTDCDDSAFKASIDNLLAAEIPTVISAGNDAFPDAVGLPGCVSSAVTVGASDFGDNFASFSNRGPLIDVFAPGVNISSEVPNNTFAVYSGTSMAAPMVTGAFADLRQANPTASVSDILNALKTTGHPISYKSGASTINTPRIDLLAAYDMLNSVNSAPFKPRPVYPKIGQDVTSGPVDLRWTGGDPDSGDTVTFSVTLSQDGQNFSPVASCTNISTLSCHLNSVANTVTYSWRVIATDNHSASTTSDDLRFNAVSLIFAANDDISNATAVTGHDTGNTGSGTLGPDDPIIACTGTNNNHSVWYTYTPPAKGTLDIDTVGSTSDTILAVWTGSRGSLLLQDCNDDINYPSNLKSQITDLPVDNGTTYYIEVNSWQSSGAYTLNTSFTPGANHPPRKPVLPSPKSGKDQVSTSPTLRWSGGDPDLGDAVTYDVYLDTNLDPTTLECSAVTASTCTPADTLTDNTLYYWKVVASDNASSPLSSTSEVFHFVTGTLPPPGNDDFDSATVISSTPFTDTQMVAGATKAGDDPILSCGDGQMNQSLWYDFTPSSTGLLTIDTRGSDSDTLLAVWQGSRGALTSVGCNDDENHNAAILTSRLANVLLLAGTTYHIEAASFYGDVVTLKLNMSFVPTKVPAPKLNSPKNGAIVLKQPIKLSWKKASKPLGYHVQVNSSQDFKGTSFVDLDFNSKTTRISLKGLPFGVYFWRVRDQTTLGFSNYSAPFSFEVTLNKSPKKNSTVKKGPVRFSWQAVAGKTYLLQVFTNPADPAGSLAFPVQTAKKSNYAMPKGTSLTANTYYWQVSIDGGAHWTLPWKFVVH